MTVKTPLPPDEVETKKQTVKAEKIEKEVTEKEIQAYIQTNLKHLCPSSSVIVAKPVIPGINYRVNFYKEIFAKDLVMKHLDIVSSFFIKIIKTPVGLDFVDQTAKKL
jgi:N12 class adenine-specific DNA methylase